MSAMLATEKKKKNVRGGCVSVTGRAKALPGGLAPNGKNVSNCQQWF